MNRDERAGRFSSIYDEHRDAVHAYFLGRTSDRDGAPDLVQETFLRVWRRLEELVEVSADRQRAWIFTVARNLTIDVYRSRATAAAALTHVQTPSVAPIHEQPEPQAELTERVAELDKAISGLPEKLRTTLTMHAVGGMNSAEIADALQEPAGTIRYRLSQARRQLADAMGSQA